MEIFDPLTMPNALWHPEYRTLFTEWKKWRLAYYGGRPFIAEYLKKYNGRETNEDYITRMQNTYCPSFAKAGIKRIINLIYSQMGGVVRQSSSGSYTSACDGKSYNTETGSGVDNSGSSMNYFMGNQVLPELLVLGKVAVYVDMPPLEGIDLYSAQGKRPYLYTYTREQIVNWRQDYQGVLESVMLREYIFEYDEVYGMPSNFVCQYRHYFKKPETPNIVYYQMLDDKFSPKDDVQILNIPIIPVVIFQLSGSLMDDIADYQIALLNIASSDVAYAWKANFPIYVEQYDAMWEMTFQNMQQGYRPTDSPTYNQDLYGNPVYPQTAPKSTGGTEATANSATDAELTIGTTKGRRIPKGLEYPQFVAPPSAPLQASMAKQEQMKKEIEELLNLNMSNLQSSSSNSPERDHPGAHNIGLELEAGERKILRLWQLYENIKGKFNVSYPSDFVPKSFESRVAESKSITDLIPNIPSNTFRREMSKKAVVAILGGSLTQNVLDKIYEEIDQAAAIVPDPNTISSDVEQGLVSTELGSKLRGYPEGETDKAKQEHADRLARIAASQGGIDSAPVKPDAGARGLSDLGTAPNAEAKREKKKIRQRDNRDVVRPVTRGEAR